MPRSSWFDRLADPSPPFQLFGRVLEANELAFDDSAGGVGAASNGTRGKLRLREVLWIAHARLLAIALSFVWHGAYMLYAIMLYAMPQTCHFATGPC